MQLSEKFSYREPVGKTNSINAEQIEFLDKAVRFSFRHCSVKKKECISSFSMQKDVLKAFYSTLGQFEKMSWQQARSVDHARAISIEPKASTNHQGFSKEFPSFQTFGHFRVDIKSKPKFRVFGTLQEDCFCILKFDVDGKTNH
jgi:hypothetical protein